MRSKEEAHDYRYFPDPDLLPLHISDERINNFKQLLIARFKRERFQKEYNLTFI